MRVFLLPLMFLLFIASNSFAGIMSFKGNEKDFWKNNFIVIAKVIKTERIKDNDYRLTLATKSTLAGTFDPTEKEVIVAEVVIGLPVSSIRDLPANESMIVVVIKKRNNHFYVLSSALGFMPNNASILPITSVTDPKVDILIDNLKKIRNENT